MRVVHDTREGNTPIEQTIRALGRQPLKKSDRWGDSGVEIAYWRFKGPHEFSYGEQRSYCVTCVHEQIQHHVLSSNQKLIRQGGVHADRFRVSRPGDDIGALVTTPDAIVMTQIYLSSAALEMLADGLTPADRPALTLSWSARNREIEAAIRLMHGHIAQARTPDWARMELLAQYIAATILREAAGPPPPRAPHRAKRIERAVQFIADNLDAPITLDDIAEAACLSPFHLCRVFRNQTGTTPRAYLQEKRLAEARRLLRETASGLDDIAAQTGFASAGSLAGAIRRRFGEGPRAIRRG